MGGGRAGIAARGSRALGRPGLWRLELCLAAERRPVRVPLALRDALPGLMQLALAEALSLASSLVRGPGLREPPDFPSPPRRSFLHPLSGAAGSLVYSCGASFACPCRATAHAAASAGRRPGSWSPPPGDFSLVPASLPG